jgi:hypothetical protein
MNLSESIIQFLSGDKLQTLLTSNNENNNKIDKTVEGATYSIILAFLKRASNEIGLEFIFKTAKEGKFSSLQKLASPGINELNAIADEGSNYISKIIPDKKSPLVTIVSTYSGVSNSVSSRVLSIATVAILEKIQEQIETKNLDINGLASLFFDQKDLITEKAPSALISKISNGVGLGTILNLKNNYVTSSFKKENQDDKTAKKQTFTSEETDDESNKKNWIIPSVFIGLLALLSFGGYYYYNNYYLPEKNSTSKIDSLVIIPADTLLKPDSLAQKDSLLIQKKDSVQAISSAKTTSISLTNGNKIETLTSGAAYESYKFLSDTSKVIRKNVSINQRYFSNGLELNANMLGDIENLGKILIAYKGSGVRLAVRTFGADSTATEKLAIQRANTIKKVLISHGVPALRIDAVGKLLPASAGKNLPELELTIMKK